MTHASTQAEVEKAIVEAHGGTVWTKWTMILAMAERIRQMEKAIESALFDIETGNPRVAKSVLRSNLADYRGAKE